MPVDFKAFLFIQGENKKLCTIRHFVMEFIVGWISSIAPEIDNY